MKEYDYGTISEDWEMTLSDYGLESTPIWNCFETLMTIGVFVFFIVALCSSSSKKEQG